ncbi:MAG: hypothetical protein IIW23_04145, partial [Clostridia bacterium]|nr:hypothetical protein [Clostridia bacterium]
MQTISLNGQWQLSGKPRELDVDRISLKAQVPGCVQLDLSREGILPEDLFMGENIRLAEEYEAWEWWYETDFTAPEVRKNVFLVFDGVDCIAEYFLNGQKIDESDNMLIAHEFLVDDYLEDGTNHLCVHLESPAVWLNKQNYCMADVRASWMGYKSDVKIRKPPHSFGWDIMPRAVTSGLWKDVKLEIRDIARFSQIAAVWPQPWSDTQISFTFQLECPHYMLKDISLKFYGSCGIDSTFCAERKNVVDKVSTVVAVIQNPKLWWPYGYGEPNVYDCTAEIYLGEELVHSQKFTYGLRKVELQRSDYTDGENGCFRFLINGTEIMCKGTNWVPLDAFHSRDKERYAEALALVKDIG